MSPAEPVLFVTVASLFLCLQPPAVAPSAATSHMMFVIFMMAA